MLHWKDLEVFKKSHRLCLELYKITNNFPKIEIYGIISQIRRAAYSVPVNIVHPVE
jgi:four helix bundle protein